MDLLLIILLANTSFQLYYARVRESTSTSHQKQWNQYVFRIFKFCCVLAIYLLITHFFNPILNGLFLYTGARSLFLIWLIYNKYFAASALFDALTKWLISLSSWIIEFAGNALLEQVGLEAQIKIFFAHMIEIFKDQYHFILKSIQMEYPEVH